MTENKDKYEHKKLDRYSDSIIQNLLQASKLLEGRITLEQLYNLDIPNFESIVDNEFVNIEQSYKVFKEKGIINAYTRDESSKSNGLDGLFDENSKK